MDNVGLVRLMALGVGLMLTTVFAAHEDGCPTPPGAEYSSKELHNHYHLYWKRLDNNIEFMTCVATTGWHGFGFSRESKMIESDLVVGWVDGEAKFQPATVGEVRMKPTSRDGSGWVLMQGKVMDGWSMFTYRRGMAAKGTGGRNITIGDNNVIWAFGGEAITSYDDVAKHAIGDRASNTINVSNGTNPTNPTLELSVVAVLLLTAFRKWLM